MNKLTPKQLLVILLVLAVGQVFAAAPTVGLVIAKSTVRIDASAVTGNATVLSGNVLESVGGTSEVRLHGGSVVMDVNAKVKVFEGRTELQSGKIQVNGSQLSTDAGELRVKASNGSEAIVERGATSVVVGAMRGSVTVTDREGTLLAKLDPGSAMAFTPEPGDQGGAGTGNGTVSPKANKVVKSGKMSAGMKAGIFFGVASAVAIPVAVVATRDDAKPVSR